MKKTGQPFREENGNAMVLGAFGIILSIMFMALMVDMGLYYNSYRRLKAAVDIMDEEIRLMLPYYAYSGDYDTVFDESLDNILTNLGYSSSNIIRSEIGRSTQRSMDDWVITVETKIELEETYHCAFAFIIGINEIPVRVSYARVQPMGTGKPYDGGPYEVWGEN